MAPNLLLLLPLLLPFAAALDGCTANGLNATGLGTDGVDNYTRFGCIQYFEHDDKVFTR